MEPMYMPSFPKDRKKVQARKKAADVKSNFFFQLGSAILCSYAY